MPPAAALRPDAPDLSAASTNAARRAVHRFCCAWCDPAVGRETDGAEPAPNYGICRSCLEAQLARLGARKPLAQLVRHAAPRAQKAALGARH